MRLLLLSPQDLYVLKYVISNLSNYFVEANDQREFDAIKMIIRLMTLVPSK